MEKIKKALAIILSIILAVSTTNVRNAVYAIETENDVICNFAALEDSIRKQKVPTGTELSTLNLPDSLSVTVEGAKEESVSTVSGSAIAVSGSAITQEEAVSSEQEKTVTEIVISNISWQILADKNEGNTEYKANQPGVYLFTPILPEKYEVAEGISLPAITITVVKNQIVLTKTVEGILVYVTADEGVFPSNELTLDVTKLTGDGKEQEIEAAIEEQLEEKSIEQTISFNVRILDADGKEVQPDTTKGNVTVTIKNVDVEQTDEVEVYHVADDYQVATPVESEVIEGEVVFEAEHFSIYTIVFESGKVYTCSLATAQTKLLKEIIEKLKPMETVISIESATSGDVGILSITDSGIGTKVTAVAVGSTTLTVSYNASATITMDISITDTFLGSGTETDPYQIGTPEQLLLFAEYVNTNVASNAGKKYSELYYILTQDIVLNEANIANWKNWYNNSSALTGWIPIGTNLLQFTGNFDGQNHGISGICVKADFDYCGVFGYNSGTIKNLKVKESLIRGDYYTGAITGYNGQTGIIENCSNEGLISTYTTLCRVGGLVGANQGTVRNCNNNGSVYGNAETGGIIGVGIGAGSVIGCYNTAKIEGGQTSLNGITGGIIGSCNGSGSLENCYNTGTILCKGSTEAYAGGIAGKYRGTMRSSYNTGTVTVTVYDAASPIACAGGIVGKYESGTMENCYNLGTVSGTGSGTGTTYVGGISGWVSLGRINHTYTTGAVSTAGGGTLYKGGSYAKIWDFANSAKNFYLNSVGTGLNYAGGSDSKTAAQFGTGEITYDLQLDQTPMLWGQDIMSSTKDAFPVFNSAPAKMVYRLTLQKTTGQLDKYLYGNEGQILSLEETIGYSWVKLPGTQVYVGSITITGDTTLKKTAKQIILSKSTDSVTAVYNTVTSSSIPLYDLTTAFTISDDSVGSSVTYTTTDTLPIGLSLIGGKIYGTPTSADMSDVGTVMHITVKGNNGATATFELTIHIDKVVPGVSTLPTISAVYGTKVEAMTFTGGTVTTAGTWSWTDSNKSDIPQAGNTTSYEATFTPSDASYATVIRSITPTISKKPLTLAMLGSIAGQFYTGSPLTPVIAVTDGTDNLITSSDYEISYSDNTNTGAAATATITASASGNYTGSASKQFTIAYLPSTGAYNITGTKPSGSDWYNNEVTIAPATGYTLSTSAADGYSIAGITVSAEGTNNVTFYLQNAEGQKTAAVTAEVKIDKTAPIFAEGQGINISTNYWNTFLNTVTFGKYFKETQTVTISASDSNSGIDSTSGYQYYLSDTQRSLAQVQALAISEWNTGSSFSVTPNHAYIIYAKILDKVGNASFISSEGIVLDNVSPTITELITPSGSNLGNVTATAHVTAEEAGTYFYIVTKNSASYTASEVKNGKSGSGTLTAATSKDITMGGLSANTDYYLSVITQDAAGNLSAVSSTTFKTGKIQTIITTLPTVNAVYGTKVEDMTFTGGTVSVAGTWSWTDSNKSDILKAGNTTSYEATFTPSDAGYATVVRSITPTITAAVVGGNYASNNNNNNDDKNNNKNNNTIIETENIVNEDGTKTTVISDKDGNIVSIMMRKDNTGEWIPISVVFDVKVAEINIAEKIAQLRVAFPTHLMNYVENRVNTSVPLTINLPIDITKSLIENQNVKEIKINMTIPTIVMESNKLKLGSIILSQDIIKDLKEAGKSLAVSVNIEGNKGYSWSFDQTLLMKAQQITDVNLWLKITADSKIEVNPESIDHNVRKQGEIITFLHSGSLPATAHIKVYVAGDYGVSGIKAGSMAYLYYRNNVTGNYDQLPNNRYTVDSEGYVTLNITHCSDYVLFSEKLDDSDTTNLLKQVKVSINNKVLKPENNAANQCALYLNGTTRRSGQINIMLPDTLLKVVEFNTVNEDTALAKIKLSYASSNANIVKVSNTGKLTAKKVGTATVTVKAELEDGSIQRYEILVTVKEAYVKFTAKNTYMVAGLEYSFAIKVYGYDAKDITWHTAEKTVATVAKNAGRLSTVVTAKTAGENHLVIMAGGKEVLRLALRVTEKK